MHESKRYRSNAEIVGCQPRTLAALAIAEFISLWPPRGCLSSAG